jgi:hypothetical protein
MHLRIIHQPFLMQLCEHCIVPLGYKKVLEIMCMKFHFSLFTPSLLSFTLLHSCDILHRISSGMHLIELRLRVEIGAGTVVGSHVGLKEVAGGATLRDGSKGGRWVYILSGEEVDQTMAADHLNSPGNVVLTSSAWDLVNKFCIGNRLENTNVFQVDMNDTIEINLIIT